MAFTVTTVYKDVKGSERCHTLKVTADAASDTIKTGLSVLTAFSLGVQSMATAVPPPRIRINETAAGTSTMGSIGISGMTSGDVIYITAFGR